MKHEGMAGANLLWLADALAVDGPALARMDISADPPADRKGVPGGHALCGGVAGNLFARENGGEDVRST